MSVWGEEAGSQGWGFLPLQVSEPVLVFAVCWLPALFMNPVLKPEDIGTPFTTEPGRPVEKRKACFWGQPGRGSESLPLAVLCLSGEEGQEPECATGDCVAERRVCIEGGEQGD